MEMPKPTVEHQRLHRLVGNWFGEERLNPSPWDPQGGVAEGHIQNRLALSGFAVIQEYEQTRNGTVTFQGHGVFTWDAGNRCYVLHWWDSMGFPPNVFTGNFEGDVLTLTYESPQGHHRVVCDLGKADAYSFRMDMSGDGDNWATFMEATYAKQPATG